MKKFALGLVLLAALVMGATAANAATIKAAGSWQVDSVWSSDMDLRSDTNSNNFTLGQRMRTKFEFIANENLKGVLETQIGTQAWGAGEYMVSAGRSPVAAATGATSAGNGNLMFRKGYIDFKWPGTSVEFLVGYQSLALPAAFGYGSAILDDHVAGAAAVVPVNSNLAFIGGYLRPIDINGYGTTAANQGGTSADVAFLIADVNFPGYKIQPFAAFAYVGKRALNGAVFAPVGAGGVPGLLTAGLNTVTPDSARAYWAGAAFTMTAFQPFKVMADLNYGLANYNAANLAKAGWPSNSRSGWLFDVAVDYTGLSMMTPEVFFAYTSGIRSSDSGKRNDSRMPVFSGENWAYGSFWMQTGDTLGAGNVTGNSGNNMGFWALGLSLKDIKLVDKLSHTFNLIYFKGTNVKNSLTSAVSNQFGMAYGSTLTTKDSIVEIDLNSKYQIYEELSLGLELGYLITDFDKTSWAPVVGVNSNQLGKDAYKVAFTLNYSF